MQSILKTHVYSGYKDAMYLRWVDMGDGISLI